MSRKPAQSSCSSKEEPPRYIFWDEFHWMVQTLSAAILREYPGKYKLHLYGIPRGGQLLALLLSYSSDRFALLDKAPNEVGCGVTFIIDDILETGKTRADVNSFHPFVVLIDKSFCHENVQPSDLCVQEIKRKRWIVMPYEREASMTEKQSRKVRGYAKTYKG